MRAALFLGHIVRGENIQLADGGVASGQTDNVGNLTNNFSIRNMMLELAAEYQSTASRPSRLSRHAKQLNN